MTSNKDEELASMSLMDHLTELRNRIGIIFIAFVVLFLLCFIRPFGEGSFNAADYVYFWLGFSLFQVLLHLDLCLPVNVVEKQEKCTGHVQDTGHNGNH